MRQIGIGNSVRFVPATRTDKQRVTGTIVYINVPHRYCCVAYPAGNTVQHECFKIFCKGDFMR